MATKTPGADASAEKRFLSLDDIMRAPDHKTITHDVPEWGGSVRLRTLTIAEREAWERGSKDDLDAGQLYAKFVALCMVDENDKRIVPDAQVEFFSRRAAGPMKAVFDAAQKLNGLGYASADAAKNA